MVAFLRDLVFMSRKQWVFWVKFLVQHWNWCSISRHPHSLHILMGGCLKVSVDLRQDISTTRPPFECKFGNHHQPTDLANLPLKSSHLDVSENCLLPIDFPLQNYEKLGWLGVPHCRTSLLAINQLNIIEYYWQHLTTRSMNNRFWSISPVVETGQHPEFHPYTTPLL